ncbi:MAG: nitrate ABC transporter permease [Phototrophicales bacterium]|nr:MAG: nitrate ABC transporter permease [Phototrophicales bacterium]
MTSWQNIAKTSAPTTQTAVSHLRSNPMNIGRVIVMLLRSVILVGIVALLLLTFTISTTSLYQDIKAATGGDVEGLLPTYSGMSEAWQTHKTSLQDRHIPATLWVTLSGLSIAMIVGLILAAIMDMVAWLRWILYPILVVSQTIPIFAIAVLLIILFGFNNGPKVIVVALFCFYPITINTLSGFRSVEPIHTNLLKTMGANRLQIWWKVRLPTAMPAFFSGLRIAATYSVVGAVIGEYVGSGDGLGKFLQRSYRSFDIDQTYLTITIIAALSVLLVLLTILVEIVALRWRYIGMFRFSTRFTLFLRRFNKN